MLAKKEKIKITRLFADIKHAAGYIKGGGAPV